MFENVNMIAPVEWRVPSNKDDLFFQPDVMQVTLNGKKTPWWMLHRGDKPISIVSGRYSLIENSLVNRAMESFGGAQLNLEPDKSYNHLNKSFGFTYNIAGANDFYDDPYSKVGQMFPKVFVRHSYDRTVQLVVRVAMFRLVCGNMLMVRVKGGSFTMHLKHVGQREDAQIEYGIHKFLDGCINETVFDGIREKIADANAKDSVIIESGFFQSLPSSLMVLYLGLISRYASMSVMANEPGIPVGNQGIVQIGSQANPERLIEGIFEENSKRNKGFIAAAKGAEKSQMERWLDDVAKIQYNEKVSNAWQLYNMLVKATQMYVRQHRRMEVSSVLARAIL